MTRFPGQTQLESDRPQAMTVAAELLALRTTVEFAPVGIAHFDLEGRFLWVNRKLCEILGRTRKEIAGRDYLELTFADDRDACRALNLRVASGEIPGYRHEKRFIRADGSLLWVCVTVSPVRNADGRIAHFIGIAEDISEQRRALEQRDLAEQRLRAALEASSTGTYRWLRDEDQVECDEALLRLFGLEGATGHMTAEIFIRRMHPDDQPRVKAAIARCNTAGATFSEEFRVPLEGGGMRWVRDVGKVFASPDGSLYMVGACTDITAAHARSASSP
jgi:PAS domain S-box-containing protein